MLCSESKIIMDLSQHIWQINEAYLPEQFRSNQLVKVNVNSKLEMSELFQQQVKSQSREKAYNNYFTSVYSNDPFVLVLPIEGEMSRSGNWIYWGSELMTKLINAAAKDKDFVGIVLKMDTPGGTADATPALAEAVAEFAKVKPIVTQTAYCASAGYYVASQCTSILMEDQASSSIGSIGTLIVYENYTEQLKMQGRDIHIIRAKGSEDKARINGIEPLSEEGKKALQNAVDVCQKEFAGAVKRGRAGKISSESLTGNMYNVSDALRLGLIDGTGDLNTAIKMVKQLAKQS